MDIKRTEGTSGASGELCYMVCSSIAIVSPRQGAGSYSCCDFSINLGPTLPELKELNIPEDVGANYPDFGTFLLNDKKGNKVGILQSSCFHRPTAIVEAILKIWLNGEVEEVPVTWKSLIDALKKSRLNVLADKVENYARSLD